MPDGADEIHLDEIEMTKDLDGTLDYIFNPECEMLSDDENIETVQDEDAELTLHISSSL